MQFRKNGSARLLWADQICINQDDIEERNHQIEFMREIYANARRTLIWIGDSDQDFQSEHARAGFALANSLAHFRKMRQEREPADKRDILELAPEELAEANIPKAHRHGLATFQQDLDSASGSIASGLSRNWWSPNLAVIHCHGYELPWDDYYAAA